CFTNAIEAAGPKWADGHVGLGRALLRRRQADRALEAFQEAARRDPTNPRAQVELGKELHRRKRFAEAEAAFGQALDAAPGDPEVWYFRGDCLRRLNRADQSLACFREAFKRKDRNPEFLRALLAALTGRSAPAETARVYAALFEVEPAAAVNLTTGEREKAARAAVQGGTGQGDELLSPAEQEKLREQGLKWLRADLKLWQKEFDAGTPAAGDRVRGRMETWVSDPVLSPTRSPGLVFSLSPQERTEWLQFWSDVSDLADRATGRPGEH